MDPISHSEMTTRSQYVSIVESLENKLQEWMKAGNRLTRSQASSYHQEAKRTILEFIRDESATELKFINLGTSTLPDIWDHPRFQKSPWSLFIEHSYLIQQLPYNLSQCQGLTKIVCKKCQNLESVFEDGVSSESIEELRLIDCPKLSSLSSPLENWRALKMLEIKEAPYLANLPESLGDCVALKVLEINTAPRLAGLPESLRNCISLEEIRLTCCRNLTELPSQLGNCKSLKQIIVIMCSLTTLPSTLGGCSELREISLSSCEDFIQLPDELVDCKNLRILNIRHCSRLNYIPERIGQCEKLQNLTLFSHYNRHALPLSLTNCQELMTLEVNFAYNLTSLPEDLGRLKKLKELKLFNCDNLEKLPDSLGDCTQLEIIDIRECQKIQALPEGLRHCHLLKELDLKKSGLRELPKDIGDCLALQSILLNNCKDLTCLPESLGSLTHLKWLGLPGCFDLTSLPESLGQCLALNSIYLRDCISLTSLPTSILNLPSTCQIDLTNCGLSHNILMRLRERTSAVDYRGPRFSFSLTHRHNVGEKEPSVNESLQNIYAKTTKPLVDFPHLLSNKAYLPYLRSWLHRLSWTAEGGGRKTTSNTSLTNFYTLITKNLELAEQVPEFRELFWNNVEEECSTCGDRVTLSVLRLGLARQRLELKDKPILEVWNYFKQAWAIDLLEECAQKKIPSLRFFDEVEVYLAYPIKLQEELSLKLDVTDMRFFDCSGVTESDLASAAGYVRSHWSNPQAVAAYLIQQSEWIAALERTYPGKMRASEHPEKRLKRETSITEKEQEELYLGKQARLKELTIEALFR